MTEIADDFLPMPAVYSEDKNLIKNINSILNHIPNLTKTRKNWIKATPVQIFNIVKYFAESKLSSKQFASKFKYIPITTLRHFSLGRRSTGKEHPELKKLIDDANITTPVSVLSKIRIKAIVKKQVKITKTSSKKSGKPLHTTQISSPVNNKQSIKFDQDGNIILEIITIKQIKIGTKEWMDYVSKLNSKT